MSPKGTLTKTLTDLQYSESPDRGQKMPLSKKAIQTKFHVALWQIPSQFPKCDVQKPKWCTMWNMHQINSTSLSQTSDMKNSFSPPSSSCYYPSSPSSSSLHGIGQVFPNFWYEKFFFLLLSFFLLFSFSFFVFTSWYRSGIPKLLIWKILLLLLLLLLVIILLLVIFLLLLCLHFMV